MRRETFLNLLALAPTVVLASRAEEAIPIEVRGGRFFAVPRTIDGRTFSCWLDTNGSGFIFDAAVRRFHLTAFGEGDREVATLPRFATRRAIPSLAIGSTLPVLPRSNAGESDPILQGFDAQLGATWFSRRIWRFDFRSGSLTKLFNPIAAGTETAKLTFERNYPCVRVQIDGDPDGLLMSFDTAASIAISGPDGLSSVRATSFVRRATFDRWRVAHPTWRFERDVGIVPGIDRITVPQVGIGNMSFSKVAFTTRPDDDVFGSTSAEGKLGANAYAKCIVWLDYPNARIRFST